MLYKHFELIDPSHWAVLGKDHQIAEVAIKDGHCAVTTTEALSLEQLSAVLTFVEDREHATH